MPCSSYIAPIVALEETDLTMCVVTAILMPMSFLYDSFEQDPPYNNSLEYRPDVGERLLQRVAQSLILYMRRAVQTKSQNVYDFKWGKRRILITSPSFSESIIAMS